MKKFVRHLLALILGAAMVLSLSGCDEFWKILEGEVGNLQVVSDGTEFEDMQIHVQIYRAVPNGSGSYSVQEKVWDSKDTNYSLGIADLDSIPMDTYLTPGEFYVVKAAFKKAYPAPVNKVTSTEYVTLKCVNGKGKTEYPAQGGYNLVIHMGDDSYHNNGNFLYYEWKYESHYNYN